MTVQAAFCGLILALPLGCATVAVPTEQRAAAELAIRAATVTGAEQVPSAALHLQLAREQAEEAHRLIEKHQYDRATSLLERAKVDAQLSLALAQEAPLREAAQIATDALQTMKKHVEP